MEAVAEKTEEQVMNIGDIKYKVYIDPRDFIWVCRCKIIKISPKGKSITFETLDCEKKSVFRDIPNGGKIAETEVEALRKFQIFLIKNYHWEIAFRKAPCAEKVIERIIETQKLIDKITFYPSI